MSNLNLLEILRFWWLLPSILSFIGLFLSIWIVVSAPTWSLLPFGVCAPEISPWLIVLNAIALILAIAVNKGWWSNLVIVCSVTSLLLSLLPLAQFPATDRVFEAEMEQVFGTDYLAEIPPAIAEKMRAKPLIITDVFRGIAQQNVRIDRGTIFASPDGVDLKLNTYRPLTSGKHPTLIVVYGGAWRTGSPDDYERFDFYMAAQGYTVIAISYRHMPKYKFPAQLDDVESALDYIQAHAEELEVDLNKTAIMGRSSGGHLASLAAYRSGRSDAISFKAVINYYGAVNLTEGYYDLPVPDPIDIQTILTNFLGGSPEEYPELYKQASPINYSRPNLPPSFLIYATRDRLVQAKFGRQMYDKLKAEDNQVVYLEVPWAEHAFDAVFFGVSNQLALYYTERFLASVFSSSASDPIEY